MKLGFYLFAEYINMFVSSAVMVTLYWGGYDIPFVNEASWHIGPFWMSFISFSVLMIKITMFLFVFLWIRWTIPRFRYDQLMNLGWKKLIPLALVNMVVTAAVMLWLMKK
jgi:NADH-quinone oxidoreductase subunit H